ncbi:MAG: IPT/TIG domain-containing protein [Bacteroidetes bacterium]|nr:IPT/TIG domain-containing protein [Bacteroidota bacterium]
MKDLILLFLFVPAFLLSVESCKKDPSPVSTAPSITSISPNSGFANTSVTITGTNFKTLASDNTVKFNGSAAAVTSASATTLIVTAPSGGTTGHVTVSTSDGTATGPVFTYQAAPSPTITSISPDSGSAGTLVTISGTNFKTTVTGDTVKFNGVAATVQTATATVLTVLAPSGASSGAVTVTTGNGTATGPIFTYAVDVYVVGQANSGWGYWKNGTFTAMPSNCVEAWSIFVNGADVYIAGADGNTGGPAYWKNGTTVDLPMTAGHNGGRARSVFVDGTDVYVAGWDFVNGANSLPRCWKNGVAMNISLSSGNISAGLPVVIGIIYKVVVSNGDVYLAGSQSPFSGNQVATYWKNGTPTPLTDGTNVSEAYDLFVAGSDLYVTANDGVTSKYWKNGVATALNTPNSFSAYPTGIYVSGTDVYVSGYYRDVAKYWKNGTMVDLTATAYNPIFNESATGITGLGSDIYISGNEISAGTGYWKNGAFTALPGASIVNGIFVK